MSTRVNFVHGIAWRATSLIVQVITLHEHGLLAETFQPHIAVRFCLQLDSATDMLAGVTQRLRLDPI